MRNIILKKLIIVPLVILCFSGCGKKEESQEIIAPVESEEDKTWITTDMGRFMVVPNMYIQDYQETSLSEEYTIAEKGSLITCLSMIDSYWNSETITPDVFLDKYENYIDSDGTCDIDSISNDFMNTQWVAYEKMEFNPEKMSELISTYDATILLEIPHSSIYGKGKSYLIITGISDNGYAAVRDPNKWNVDNLAYEYKSTNGEYLYPLCDILSAAGNEAIMYVYRWEYNE